MPFGKRAIDVARPGIATERSCRSPVSSSGSLRSGACQIEQWIPGFDMVHLSWIQGWRL